MSSKLALFPTSHFSTAHNSNGTPENFSQVVRERASLPFNGAQPALIVATYFQSAKKIAHLAAIVPEDCAVTDMASRHNIISQGLSAAAQYVAPSDRVSKIDVTFLPPLDADGLPIGITEASETQQINDPHGLRAAAGYAAMAYKFSTRPSTG